MSDLETRLREEARKADYSVQIVVGSTACHLDPWQALKTIALIHADWHDWLKARVKSEPDPLLVTKGDVVLVDGSERATVLEHDMAQPGNIIVRFTDSDTPRNQDIDSVEASRLKVVTS